MQFELEHAHGHGIVLPELKIGLDTRFSQHLIQVISHAHADHVPHKTKRPILASPATIDLMIARGFKGDYEKLDFYTPFETDVARITLFPAGHILGSAQIFIESEKGNLLYTGDFKYPASPVSEGCFFPEKPIDIFIAEATFGLPIYKWKPQEFLDKSIVDFAKKHLNNGYTPIFLAYNLGKGQEVMHALAKAEIPMTIHDAGFELCKVYEQYGFHLGNYKKLGDSSHQGRALIIPSNALDSGSVQKISKQKVAYVSGWAALEARRQQMIIDARIPLSDHIDFYELLRVVEQLKPKKTYITHSPNPDMVCYFLQKNGFDAQPLGEHERGEDS
ncbi:hypothetical protein EP331_04200 [bacterium]|nr:MAG: hypothetical protein EP331_04200 [bacterium]